MLLRQVYVPYFLKHMLQRQGLRTLWRLFEGGSSLRVVSLCPHMISSLLFFRSRTRHSTTLNSCPACLLPYWTAYSTALSLKEASKALLFPLVAIMLCCSWISASHLPSKCTLRGLHMGLRCLFLSGLRTLWHVSRVASIWGIRYSYTVLTYTEWQIPYKNTFLCGTKCVISCICFQVHK